jgi:hypothetical protein
MISTNIQRMFSVNCAFAIGIVLVILFSSSASKAQWSSSSGKVYTSNSSDKVGVGTNDPSTKLHVSGGDISVDSDQGIRKAGDNWIIGYISSLPGIVIGSGTSTDQVKIQAGGAERLRINANGNVGIGTTSPLGKLTVTGTSRDTIGDGQRGILQLTTGTGAQTDEKIEIGIVDGSRAWLQVYKAGTATRDLALQPLGGYVGIGTSSPSQPLHIEATTAIAYLKSTTGTSRSFFTAQNGTGSFYAGVDNSSGNGIVNGSVAYAGVVSTASNTPLVLGANNTAYMTIGTSGNVGIGTTSPAVKLHIVGSGQALVVDAGNNSDYFALQTLSSTAGVSGRATGASLGNSSAWFGIQTNSDNNANSGFYVKGTSGSNPVFTVNTAGNVTITGTINAKYQDVAEWVPSSERLAAGTIVVLDSTKSNQVTSSSVSYDTRVAGVVSEQPGIALGEKGDGKVLVATTGRVRVKVDATKSPIHIGDLLVTSDVPGMAMKSEPIMIGGRQIHAPGTLIGKALEPLEKGKGEILVLLSLQ